MKLEVILAIVFVITSVAFIFWARKEVREMERNKYKKSKIHSLEGGKK